MTTYCQDSFTLSLHVQSAQNLPTQAEAAFCTMLMWSNSSNGGPGKSTTQPKCTALKAILYNQPVDWNEEELQMDVTDPATEVLTVRVKDRGDSLIASCNIYLAHLRPGQTLDQWFQLHPAGHIQLKMVLTQNQPSIPTPVGNSPYSSDFQALLELQMKKIATMSAAMTNASPQPTNNIAALREIQNKAQENARLIVNLHMQQQQQSFNSLLQSQLQAQNAAQYPPSQQSTGHNFHEMMGTAANASTIAANLQQLNGGGNAGNGAMGTAASIGLGALGLGPFGAFFG